MVSDTISIKHKNCNMIVSFHSRLEGANYIKLLNQNPNILVTYYQGTLNFKQLIKIGRVFCSVKSQLFMLWYNKTYIIN
jgi:hypothetical protein